MTSYVKITDFASKDALLTGNPSKVVKGTEIGAEFDNLQLADVDNVKISGLAAGVATFIATPTSANLATVVTDETGSGALVFATSPTLVTPVLGVAAATTINKVTLTAPATGATLTVTDGKTLTANNTLTLAGTDGTTMTFPTTSATLARTDAANTFTGVQTMTSAALTTPVLTNPSFSGATADMGTVTTIDINGGTIDGAVIGGASPAALTCTTLSATNNVTLGDGTTDTVTVNGYMGVGGAANPQYGIRVDSAALTGTSQHGFGSFPVATSAATSAVRAMSLAPATVAASFTVGEATGLLCGNATKGAGSTITNQRAVYILDQTQGANNFGIESQVSSGTNKWNIYASGTAANYFAGSLLVGTTATTNNLSGEQKLALVAAGPGVFPGLSAVAYSGTSATAASIADLKRSRGTADGSLTVVASGDDLGYIRWWGADGSAFVRAAQISAQVDGTPGANDMPGRLLFSTTADGAASPTERMRIDSSGQVGIGLTPTARNNTRLQLVDGIGFPATQVASSDANTLDDYEEGIFTPTIVGSTAAGVGTYTVQTGFYTKVGRKVSFNAVIVWTAHTGTGDLRIASLPFTSMSTANSDASVNFGYVANLALTAGNILTGLIGQSASTVILYQTTVGGGAATTVPIDTAATIYVSGTYFTA